MKTRTPWHIRQYLKVGVTDWRGKAIVQGSFWLAAGLTGVAAVLFGQLITKIQAVYVGWFLDHPYLTSLWTPVSFLLAAGVCRYLSPEAGGSGVPQVLHAAASTKKSGVAPDNPRLVSARTSLIKVASTALGFLGGASIGGEGPTVQISGSIFAHLGKRVRKLYPQIDLHSFLVAGAGAGIAAAFNTPLGGIAFAMEEVALEGFGKLRHMVMLGIIVSGLAAQGLAGDELYFGHTDVTIAASFSFLCWAALIGVAGGLAGGAFGRLAASTFFIRTKLDWWAKALICGLAVMLINLVFHGTTAGSGYVGMRSFLAGAPGSDEPLAFPIAKLAATGLSTLSGMGGGILAPSLSIGGWLGVAIGKLASLQHLRACAFIGMVAYFSGAFQVPITALVIANEMTIDNTLVIPMMIAALVATLTGKIIMPKSLYHVLIERNYHHKALAAEAAGGEAGAAALAAETAQAAGTTPEGSSATSQ